MRYQLAEKNKIMSLFHKGETVSQIRLQANVSKSTLYRWKEEYDTTGQVLGLIRKGKIDEAKQGVKQFQETHPNSDELFISKIINQLIWVEYFEYAKELAEEVLAKNPNNIHVISQLIKIEKINGNIEAVKRLCEKTLTLNPNDEVAKRELIKLANQKRSAKVRENTPEEKSQEKYKKILSIQTSINRAKQAGDMEKVERLCEKILELDPNYTPAMSQLIVCKKQKGDWDAVEQLCERILQLEPDNVQAMNQLIACKKQKGDWDAVEQLCERRLQIEPDNVQAMSQLIAYKKQKGDWDAVEQLCERRLQIEPDNVQTMSQLIACKKQKGDWKSVEQLCERRLQLEPNAVKAMSQLITCKREKDDWDAVEQIDRRILSIEPKNVLAKTQLATIYRRREELDTAEQLYKEILEIDPNNADAKNQLIVIADIKRKRNQKGTTIRQNVGTANQKQTVSYKKPIQKVAKQSNSRKLQLAIREVRQQIQEGTFLLDDIEAKQKEMKEMGIDDVQINLLLAEAYEHQNLPKQTKAYLKKALQEAEEPKLQKAIKALLEAAQTKKKKPSHLNPWDSITVAKYGNNVGQTKTPMVLDEK